MLQRSTPELPSDRSLAPPIEQGGVSDLLDFALGFVRRHYLIILIGMLLGMAAGVAFVIVIPPTYTADAKVIVVTQKAQFIQQQSMFTDGPVDNAQMESQLQLLKSKAIALSVVEKLKLVDDPEFVSPPAEPGVLRRLISSCIRTLHFAWSAARPDTDSDRRLGEKFDVQPCRIQPCDRHRLQFSCP